MTHSLLDQIPVISQIRRNHALEHATMKILSGRYRGVKMAGVSNPSGFFLVADLPTELVTDAALEAHKRLDAGEEDLAIHPNCGTNSVVSGLLAGAAAFGALVGTSLGKKPKWYNYLLAVAVAVPVYIFSKPLGLMVQKTITTQADQGDSRVKMVTTQKTRRTFLHKITTGG